MDLSTLPPEEIARRARQRELRLMALKLQSEGKVYNPQRAKLKKSHKPRRAVQVIIIPVFWKQKHAEQDSIFQLADRIQADLRAAGIRCDCDTTNELTPGQKYRNWEEKGVRVRLEIGPREATAKNAVLALTSAPGEVAQRTTLAAGPKLVAAVVEKLKALGQEVEACPVTGPNVSGPAHLAAAPVEAGASGKAQPSSGAAVKPAAAAASGTGKKAAPPAAAAPVHASGDQLDDDWVADGEAGPGGEAAAPAPTSTGKKQKKKGCRVVRF